MSEPPRQQSHKACKIRRIASCKHLRAPIIRDNESPNQLAFQECMPAYISCLCKHSQVHNGSTMENTMHSILSLRHFYKCLPTPTVNHITCWVNTLHECPGKVRAKRSDTNLHKEQSPAVGPSLISQRQHLKRKRREEKEGKPSEGKQRKNPIFV